MGFDHKWMLNRGPNVFLIFQEIAMPGRTFISFDELGGIEFAIYHRSD